MLINREKAITKLEALFAKMAKNRYDRADESLAREVECISEQVTEALRALPVSDGVTDEMCLHAGNVFHDALTAGKSAPEAMRAALEAALGPLPAPPTIE